MPAGFINNSVCNQTVAPAGAKHAGNKIIQLPTRNQRVGSRTISKTRPMVETSPLVFAGLNFLEFSATFIAHALCLNSLNLEIL
jgi:hypothetical protein